MLHETDPNLLVLPDFSTAEHEEACIQLVNDGIMDEQAARMLASLWMISNNTAKVHWDNRLEQITAEQRRVEEEEDCCTQVLPDEQEAARLEERKKNEQCGLSSLAAATTAKTITPDQAITTSVVSTQTCPS